MKDFVNYIKEALFRDKDENLDSAYMQSLNDKFVIDSINNKTIKFKSNAYLPEVELNELNDFLKKYPKYNHLYFDCDKLYLICKSDGLDIKNIKIEGSNEICIRYQSYDKCKNDMNDALIKAKIVRADIPSGYTELMKNVVIECDINEFVIGDFKYFEKEIINNYKIHTNILKCKSQLNIDKDTKDFLDLKNKEIPQIFNNFDFNIFIYVFDGGRRGIGFDKYHDTRRVFAFSKKQFDSALLKYIDNISKKLKNGYYFLKKSNTHYLHVVDKIIEILEKS